MYSCITVKSVLMCAGYTVYTQTMNLITFRGDYSFNLCRILKAYKAISFLLLY